MSLNEPFYTSEQEEKIQEKQCLQEELIEACKQMYEIVKEIDHDCRWVSGGDMCRGCADLQRWEDVITKAERG